jgi:hypothetical protein
MCTTIYRPTAIYRPSYETLKQVAQHTKRLIIKATALQLRATNACHALAAASSAANESLESGCP